MGQDAVEQHIKSHNLSKRISVVDVCKPLFFQPMTLRLVKIAQRYQKPEQLRLKLLLLIHCCNTPPVHRDHNFHDVAGSDAAEITPPLKDISYLFYVLDALPSKH